MGVLHWHEVGVEHELDDVRGASTSTSGHRVDRTCDKRANNPFSIDLRLLAGSAVVLLCAYGRLLHGVFGVLGRL